MFCELSDFVCWEFAVTLICSFEKLMQLNLYIINYHFNLQGVSISIKESKISWPSIIFQLTHSSEYIKKNIKYIKVYTFEFT